jgi:hypothetical protein
MRTWNAIVLLTLLANQAGALCNLPRPRVVCAEYFQSKAVVVARLAGTSLVKDSYGDVVGTYYSMTVEQSLRGQVSRLFRIYEGNDSGRAPFDWKTGNSYLLFLREENPNGGWMIDGCGNSGPSESTKSALQQIEAIDPAANQALIQGVVWDFATPGPVAGVKIEARGPDGTNTAETKDDGRFVIRVVPGRYQVWAFSPGKTFVAKDISYEHPDNVVLESGSCAQIQFVEATKK